VWRKGGKKGRVVEKSGEKEIFTESPHLGKKKKRGKGTPCHDGRKKFWQEGGLEKGNPAPQKATGKG